jgi:hypothetical protein
VVQKLLLVSFVLVNAFVFALEVLFLLLKAETEASAYVRIRQHTSGYVSIRIAV